jgi:hypothetical protein
MSKFSASDAAFSGFRLVRENLKTVAIWALLMTVVSIIHTTVTIHFFGPQFEALSNSMDSAATDGDTEAFAKVSGGMTVMMLWLLPYSLALSAIVLAAVNRLVLKPQDRGFFYLGFGMAELRQVGVGVLTYLVAVGVMLVGALLTGFMGAMGGVTGGVLGLLSGLGTVGALIFLLVRLSFASSATFEAGKIMFFRSMPLTQGSFWPLLGAYLLAIVMAIIVFLLMSAIIAGAAALISGDLGVSARMMRADTSSLAAYFSPIGIAQSLFSGVLAVLTNLVLFAPAPSIYKALKEREAPPEPSAGGNGGW